jgi:hypothetical protein
LFVEALRVHIEYIRIFLEAVSAFDPVWTKPLRFFFDLAWFRTNLSLCFDPVKFWTNPVCFVSFLESFGLT